ncbi:MAG: alpha/beta hydrolase [Pseudomonadota bacterium]
MAQITANGINIEYEEIGDKNKPTILLVMGLSGQLIMWPDSLFEGLAEQGFRVVRYDNRDVGLSHKFEDAGAPDIMAIMGAVAAGQPVPPVPYKLDDMALDAVGVLDALNIDKAHIVGASMGGMIAQLVAANHPERTQSLVSIMSTTGNPDLPPAAPEVMARLVMPPPGTDRDSVVPHTMETQRIIGSPGYQATDEERHHNAGRYYDRAYYPIGVTRQMAAIIASDSRTEKLASVKAPTLVIHGKDDPLVPLPGGEDTAKCIPNARLEVIDGMGHDLPAALVPKMIDLIAGHAAQA